jgi:UDP-3-O-[3-hydroxymyristoyl] glucosamine N-acyltransferase
VKIKWGSLICNNVQIGNSCIISRNCIIGKEVYIGNSVHIEPSVTIYYSKIGDDVIIGEFARITNLIVNNRTQIERDVICTGFQPGKIYIGSDTYIGIGAILDWSGNLIIGNYVHIAGPSTGLWTHSSIKQALNGDELKNNKNKLVGSIEIKDKVWIGGNCTIYPGIKISTCSIILPNSVVNRNIKSFTMVGGTPCKKIRDIKLIKNEYTFNK